MTDISPDFVYNATDAAIVRRLTLLAETPRAIVEFDRKCRRLSDYGYWFGLSTLWVSYTGFSDLRRWKRLFASDRPRRDTSLMKPSELAAWRRLPDEFPAFRAHRADEDDWIAYTLDPTTAARFARERGILEVTEYRIRKADALCLFLRRGESEVLVLDRTKPERVRTIPVVVTAFESFPAK